MPVPHWKPPSIHTSLGDHEGRARALERAQNRRHYVDGDPLGGGWKNGWGDTGDGTEAEDVLTWYAWILGGGLDMMINAEGGADLTIMFSLPPGFWRPGDGKQTFSAVDDAGDFTCYTVVPNDDAGPPHTVADVYQGRI